MLYSMQGDNAKSLSVHMMSLFGDYKSLMICSRAVLGCIENGPKTVKVFKNQPGTLDFDSADSMEPIKTIE